MSDVLLKHVPDNAEKASANTWRAVMRASFASAAMQGLLENAGEKRKPYESVALQAVKYADALIKKLNV